MVFFMALISVRVERENVPRNVEGLIDWRRVG